MARTEATACAKARSNRSAKVVQLAGLRARVRCRRSTARVAAVDLECRRINIASQNPPPQNRDPLQEEQETITFAPSTSEPSLHGRIAILRIIKPDFKSHASPFKKATFSTARAKARWKNAICCNTELACVGQCNFNLRLRARRAKDGHNKGTLRADDLYLLVGSVLAGLREFFLNGKLCVCAKKRLQIRFGHVNVTCGGFNHNFHLKIPVLSGFCISILLRTDRKYKFWAMFFLRFMINLMQKRP